MDWYFKWTMLWLQALIYKQQMFCNKILWLIYSCSHRVMVGIGEQVYSVLLLSFFFLEVKYAFASFLFFVCLCLCFCTSIVCWWSCYCIFILHFCKHIVSLDMLLIYNKLNVTLLSLYLLDDRHDRFWEYAGFCCRIYTLWRERAQFPTPVLDVCLLLFRVCGAFNLLFNILYSQLARYLLIKLLKFLDTNGIFLKWLWKKGWTTLNLTGHFLRVLVSYFSVNSIA